VRTSSLVVAGAVALALAIAIGLGAFAAGHYSRATTTVTVAGTPTTPAPANVSPQVAAGAHDFVQFACGQCHGDQGQGGVSPDVPSLSQVGKTLTPKQLRSIINHGLGESANPKKPYMPVWGEVISKHQVGDLVAYIRAGLPAVPTATPVPIPQGQGPAVEGAALYVRYGCINCHGPNGLGGVPNPQSPDKTIPSLTGAGYHEEFNTDAKVIEMIRSGSVLGQAPIVSMPHWGGIIPAGRLNAIVAYLKTLK
jgi:mono/diheme cytochrome c family protein